MSVNQRGQCTEIGVTECLTPAVVLGTMGQAVRLDRCDQFIVRLPMDRPGDQDPFQAHSQYSCARIALNDR